MRQNKDADGPVSKRGCVVMLLRHHFTRPAFWLDLVAGAAFLLVPAFILLVANTFLYA